MNDQQQQARNRAVDLFVHYFKAVAAKAGMTWDRDYSVEIEAAVDAIIEAATPPAKTEHAQRVERLRGGDEMGEAD
jgi:hypothetical protein